MWILYAFASAFFAGVTAVLAKLGMLEGVNSHLATALRTIVVALFGWAIVWVAGSSGAVGALEPRSWLFLILSGLATGGSWLCLFSGAPARRGSQVAPVDKIQHCADHAALHPVTGRGGPWNTLLGMGLIVVGSLGMLQRKPRERKLSGWGWAALGGALRRAREPDFHPGQGRPDRRGLLRRHRHPQHGSAGNGLGSGARAGAPAGDSRCAAAKLGFSGCVPAWLTGPSWMFYYRGRPGGAGQRCGPHRQAEHSGDGRGVPPALRERRAGGLPPGCSVLTCGTLLLLL